MSQSYVYFLFLPKIPLSNRNFLFFKKYYDNALIADILSH